jgi:hypothetical protein
VPTATLAEIMDALADQIWEAINNVLDVDVQVEPRMVLSPTPPTIDMYPADPSTDPDLRAFTDMLGGELIVVRARVQTADHEAGQDLLLALMDDEDDLSIVRAIQADPTLGGLASRRWIAGSGRGTSRSSTPRRTRRCWGRRGRWWW